MIYNHFRVLLRDEPVEKASSSCPSLWRLGHLQHVPGVLLLLPPPSGFRPLQGLSLALQLPLGELRFCPNSLLGIHFSAQAMGDFAAALMR